MTTITYAIGDVHGEAQRLRAMHSLIRDRHASKFGDASIRIVHLGDYVDRGPDSFGVIDMIMQLAEDPAIELIALAGNHEAMLLEAADAPNGNSNDHWLKNGGRETLKSYVARGHDSVTRSHIDWMRALPAIYIDHPQKRIFVHAGVSPDEFPNEAREVYLWTRSSEFFDVTCWQNTRLADWTVVHGHTPTSDGFPDVVGDKCQRINLDSGAVFGGRLSCAVFAPDAPVRFIYT